MREQLAEFLAQLATPITGEELFDHLNDVVYFVKDHRGAYLLVNRTLVERCGAKNKAELIGRRVVEVMGEPLGRRFEDQDRQVIATGKPIISQLELHLHRTGEVGWCLTTKLPLHSRKGRVIGLLGASQDLRLPNFESAEYGQLARAIETVEADLSNSVNVAEMAQLAGMSRYQLDRRMKAVFGLSAGQWLVKQRITRAQGLLKQGDLAIAQVALAVGYSDQSAFTRQFRESTGLTPTQFRGTP